ncbi:hypothetical protein [Paraburkholderia kururiensis]|uniref:Uncharacterized protein n=1 Tax=Paraburkholderia kururiensis TaxID=984307 RepID=A0ABZ0WP85_9BURK|nr:hypothetical protein [Paraburkholderia kururiensis]WQD79114.1 hypothetical protein U0042_05260 [Paraburkholderia kururiensis]
MNTSAKRFTNALLHPGARLTQHLRLWIGSQERDFTVLGSMCGKASFTFVGPDNVPTPLPVLPKSDLQVNDRPPHTN